MLRLPICLFRLPLAAASAFSLVPSTFAQQEQMNALAARMVPPIQRSHSKHIVVFDFTSADPRLGPLGSVLADELATALAAPSYKLRVIDRDAVKRRVAAEGLEPENVPDDSVASWLAREFDAESLMLGTLERDDDNIRLSLNCYDSMTGVRVAGEFEITIPLTGDISKLIPDTAERKSGKQFVSPDGVCTPLEGPPCSSAEGIDAPKCIDCSPPFFSDEATQRRVGGVVKLVVIVDENGKVHDIRVVQALSHGLTLQAIHTVEKWKLRPAKGTDGKPIAVRTPIDLTFQFLGYSP